MNNRLVKLRQKLAEKGLDAIIINQANNRRYLSGFHGTAGYLIITEKQAILATDFRYTEQAKTEAPDFTIHRINGGVKDWLPALVNDLNVKTMGFESWDVTYEVHRQLRQALKKASHAIKLVPTLNFIDTIRAVKEPEEIEFITKACEIVDVAFESVITRLDPAMTEKQLAWEMEKALRENGSESIPFDVIVGSGPNAALPHAKPSDRVIGDGGPIVIDMGAKYKGYASDLTRTVFCGELTDKFAEVYYVVQKAQQKAIDNIKQGMTGKAADAIARKVIDKAGFSGAFGHSLGHGVGYAEHEMPYLSPNSREKLADGMVFTVEPGIYLEGWGGIRIEDTVVLEGGKVKLLTKARKITC